MSALSGRGSRRCRVLLGLRNTGGSRSHPAPVPRGTWYAALGTAAGTRTGPAGTVHPAPGRPVRPGPAGTVRPGPARTVHPGPAGTVRPAPGRAVRPEPAGAVRPGPAPRRGTLPVRDAP